MNEPHYHINLFWSAEDECWIAEVPDLLTWVGGGIVFGSSFYIAWREAKLRKAKALSPAQSALPGTNGKH